jgi:hypothetical protein
MQHFSNTTQRPTTLHPVTMPHPPKPLPAFRFGHAAGEEYRYSTLKRPDAQNGILFPIPERTVRLEQPLSGSSGLGSTLTMPEFCAIPSFRPLKLICHGPTVGMDSATRRIDLVWELDSGSKHKSGEGWREGCREVS